MDARARTETITRQVSESLAGSGVVVDDVSVQQAGRRRLVRVFLARDVSGLAADDTTSTVEPLSSAASELYSEEQPEVQVTVGSSGTGGGFEAFCAGRPPT